MDFDPSCFLSMSKDGCRKITAMHVTLNAAVRPGHVSGQTTNKSLRKPPSCDWLALHVQRMSFVFFFPLVKTDATPKGEKKN